MFKNAAPWFLVDDVDGAAAWYTRVYAAKLQHTLPRTPPFQWVSLLLGDVEIMLSGKDDAQEWYSPRVNVSEAPANFIAYIYVEDINTLWDRIKADIEVLMQPKDQFYGIREFAVRDPFGFVIVFAQEGFKATCDNAQQ